MTLAEKISKQVQALPEPLQEEVLDFIEYLESKQRKDQKDTDRAEWLQLSLYVAMHGMEDEDTPYSLEDIKERMG